jgi:dolichol-phosphate mannosyltransferase
MQIVIVDHNFHDGTWDVVAQLQKIFPGKIKLHARPGKLGLGSVFIDALGQCTSEYVILMDADLPQEPWIILKFIKKQRVTGTHTVSRSRYPPHIC